MVLVVVPTTASSSSSSTSVGTTGRAVVVVAVRTAVVAVVRPVAATPPGPRMVDLLNELSHTAAKYFHLNSGQKTQSWPSAS